MLCPDRSISVLNVQMRDGSKAVGDHDGTDEFLVDLVEAECVVEHYGEADDDCYVEDLVAGAAEVEPLRVELLRDSEAVDQRAADVDKAAEEPRPRLDLWQVELRVPFPH